MLNSVNNKHTRRLLRDLYHRNGPGRKPLNPLAMLKSQLLKHLLRIPSDRRLSPTPQTRQTNSQSMRIQETHPQPQPLHPLQTQTRPKHLQPNLQPAAPETAGGWGCEGRRHRRRQHPRRSLQPTSPGQPHRQERPRSPRRQRQTRIHPRIPGAHRMLRRVGDAPRLHRGPVIRERQGLLQAAAGKGALPGRRVQGGAG